MAQFSDVFQLFKILTISPRILVAELAQRITYHCRTNDGEGVFRQLLGLTALFATSSLNLTVPTNTTNPVLLSVCVREHAIPHLFMTLRPVTPSIAPSLSFVE